MPTTRRGPVRQAVPPERWQEVVDNSAELFYRDGYASTSVNDIADALGITKGSLYHYIQSKEDLLFAIIERLHELTLDNLRRNQDTAGTAIDRLLDYFTGHIRINTRLLHQAAVGHTELGQLGEQRRATIVAQRDEVQSHVRALLTEGQSTGEVRRDLDIKTTSIFMFCSANSVHTWFCPDGPLDADEVAARLAEYIVAGVRSQGHDPSP